MPYVVAAIIAVFIVLFVVKAVSTFKKAREIDNAGVETEAEVSRIEIEVETNDTGSSRLVYVTYRDENGVLRESLLSIGSSVGLNEGDKLKIKYLPGEYKIVRPAEKTLFV